MTKMDAIENPDREKQRAWLIWQVQEWSADFPFEITRYAPRIRETSGKLKMRPSRCRPAQLFFNSSTVIAPFTLEAA